MKSLLSLLVVLVSISYPLLVYLGLQHLSPAVFALILASLASAKFIAHRKRTTSNKSEYGLLAVTLAYCLTLLVVNSELLLKLYPVLISFAVALLFGLSLSAPESLIERLARLAGETITPRAKHYTRRLTAIWALLLVANGLCALYLALFASLKSWALYSGLVSYLVLGSFFALEYAYRRYYMHKHRAEP